MTKGTLVAIVVFSADSGGYGSPARAKEAAKKHAGTFKKQGRATRIFERPLRADGEVVYTYVLVVREKDNVDSNNIEDSKLGTEVED